MPWCLLPFFLLFYTGGMAKADQYSEVRLLSSRHYADTHNVQQDLPTGGGHTAGRLLFSWDLPEDKRNLTENDLKSNFSSTKKGNNISLSQSSNKTKNNSRWPLKNYEHRLESRNHKGWRNNKVLLDISPRSDQTTEIQFRNKKRHNRNHGKKKHKSKKHNKLSKTDIKNRLHKDHFQQDKPINVGALSGNKVPDVVVLKSDRKISKTITKENEETEKDISTNLSENLNRSLEINKHAATDSNKVRNTSDSYNFHKNSDKNHSSSGRREFKNKWKLPVLLMANKNYSEGDVNECVINNGGCDGLCVNLPGSYRCHCPTGFRLDHSGRKCLDVNECVARNGHGPCQGGCVNTWGGYRCSCDTVSGTTLAADHVTCRDIDECTSGHLSCSHGCVNTFGSAFCLCPDGYVLGQDLKTCLAIAE